MTRALVMAVLMLAVAASWAAPQEAQSSETTIHAAESALAALQAIRGGNRRLEEQAERPTAATPTDAPTTCTNGAFGSEPKGVPCVFPFVHNTITWTTCKGNGYGGGGWCATTSSYDEDEKWGGCEPCPAPTTAAPTDAPTTAPTGAPTFQQPAGSEVCSHTRCEVSNGHTVVYDSSPPHDFIW